MTTKTPRLIILAAFVAALTLTISLRAAIPPAENLLPADTLFVVTAPDCAAMRNAMRESPQWMLWDDPAMKPFHDKFMDKWNETVVAPLEDNLGVKLADFADLLQGQLTFAITQNGWSGTGDQLPGAVLLLDAKDKSDLLKTNLAALQKKWTDAGKSIRTETIRDVSFSIVPLSSNNVPASVSGMFPKSQSATEPGEVVIGQFESLLIVGSSIGAVEPVVAHLTGGSAPALNDNADFAADKLTQFRDAPMYYGWFNAKTFFTVLSHIPPPEPNPNAFAQIPWDKVLAASGALGLKSASFSERESHDGSQVNFFLSVPEADRTGLFKMMATEQKDANPPLFVPADAVKFWRARVDGQKDWATWETMFGNISPAALNMLNTGIAMANASAQQRDPSFDFRKYFISNLGDDFISYAKAPVGTSIADLNSAPSIFLFASSNPDQSIQAIKNITSLMAQQPDASAPRDFLGKKIYCIPLPVPGLAGTTMPARLLYLTASSGYVAISADSSIVENFLRSAGSPAKPLRETDGLAEAAERVGGADGGLFGYQDNNEIMRSTFTLLKNQSDSTAGLGTMAALPKSFRDWMDFSLLPDYDLVSKYFYFSVFGSSTTVDGISFKAFAPRPPQLY
jgi:hypothetical protein